MRNFGSHARSVCQQVLIAAAGEEHQHAAAQHQGEEVPSGHRPAPRLETGAGKSRRETSANQSTIHNIPTAPTSWNGNRQLPGASVSIRRITRGIRIVDRGAALENPLPRARSCGANNCWVVLIAHGQ